MGALVSASWTLSIHSCLALDQILLPHPEVVNIGGKIVLRPLYMWVKCHLRLAVL